MHNHDEVISVFTIHKIEDVFNTVQIKGVSIIRVYSQRTKCKKLYVIFGLMYFEVCIKLSGILL